MNVSHALSEDFQSRLRRLSWRVRRGMLENDLLLSHFFEQQAEFLTETDIEMLDILLDLSDDVLLKVLLNDVHDELFQQFSHDQNKQKALAALIQKITLSNKSTKLRRV